ncbi:MAG TPA: hypothetical protein VF251_01910 [Pyrinomonadaceae bacterium]
MKYRPLLLLLLLTFSLLTFDHANAQTTASTIRADVNSTRQNVAAALASLPEADTLIYINPRRILNDAIPRVLPASQVAELRKGLEDVKKDAGVDLTNLDYVVLALRFRKPAADLSFTPPEVMAVASGDLSADSLMTMVQLALQEKAREETHGDRKIAITKIDPIAEAAEKNPLLKSFSEIGFTALNANTIAVGTVGYLKAAVDAANGEGRVANTAISSLIRDPNALISAAGSPLAAFAKSFGLLGTQETPRDPRCETSFGNFYAAVNQEGNAFNLRGAMNADNPDTAKIINGLLSGLMQTAITSLPEKERSVLQGIKLTNNESEVVISGSIPETTIADLIKQQTTKTTTTVPTSTTGTPAKKKVIRRKRRPVKQT